MTPAPAGSGLSAVLVHLDDGPDARARCELAITIADRFGARLIGAAAAQPIIPVYAPYGEGLIALQPEIAEAARAQIERTVNDAKAVFDEVVGKRADIEWRASSGRRGEDFIVEQSRAANLIVVGRRGPNEAPDPVLGISPPDILMAAGRPVLITPPQIRGLAAARVLVAWKDSREARRALSDAMPFLRAAQDVFVASVGPEASPGSVQDVVAALKRADVPARALVEDIGRNPPGEALVEIARRAGADLIVAGAFGHSRTREWIFGGVTRDLLNRAPMCCLLSH
ncbi:MAG: universal stress protein [Alphaproteobacteria bacterium]|nr:universal stress protein [Alphaproteobacteria bacterium]